MYPCMRNAPVAHVDDGRRVDLQLDAALAALVLAFEDDHSVAGIEELLWLDLVLVPHLLLFRIQDPGDLAEATRDDLAFPDASDRPV